MKNAIYAFLFLLILFFALSCSEGVSVVEHEPVIESLKASRTQVYTKEFVTLQAIVTDKDKGDKLVLKWSANGGKLTNESNNPTQWHAPDYEGTFTIRLHVSDGFFEVQDSLKIKVISHP